MLTRGALQQGRNFGITTKRVFPKSFQSRTQSNACARARMALALGKLNFSCAVIGLTFINRACRQRTGTPKFRGSGCQFPQSQCHPSPRTGIALGTRLKSFLRDEHLISHQLIFFPKIVGKRSIFHYHFFLPLLLFNLRNSNIFKICPTKLHGYTR